MTLIVGKRTDQFILMVSDTQLSSKTLLTNGTCFYTRDNPILSGIAKIHLIDDFTAIAFAGGEIDAEDSVKNIGQTRSPEKIVEILRKITAQQGCCTEYILASLKPQPSMHKISKGIVEPSSSCWIGDEIAFNKFQGYFTGSVAVESECCLRQLEIHLPEGSDSEQSTTYSKLMMAMTGTVWSQTLETVGGIVVPVCVENGKFAYGSYCMSIGEQYSSSNSDSGTVLSLETASDIFSLTATASGRDQFAVHIPQGNLGVVFSRSAGRAFMESEVIANTTVADFGELTAYCITTT